MTIIEAYSDALRTMWFCVINIRESKSKARGLTKMFLSFCGQMANVDDISMLP